MLVAQTGDFVNESSPRPIASLVDETLNIVRRGDLLLVGGNDWISRCMKFGSKSELCHAGVFLSEDEVIESYDEEFTLDEGDDGVVAISVRDFLGRNLSHLRVVRPYGIDLDRFDDVVGTFTKCSAPYPSVGAFIAAACLAANPVLKRIPAPVRRPMLTAQVRLAGDGAVAMHCAEAVTRLYHATGLAIEIPNPLFDLQIEHTRDYLKMPIQPLRTFERVPTVGRWPRPQNVLQIAQASGSSVLRIANTVRERWKQPPDEFDFLVPADLGNSPSFYTLAEFYSVDGQWRSVNEV